MKFSVGEIAIALSSREGETYQPRTKGCAYPVFAISYCARCGEQKINISGKSTSGNLTVRCYCGHIQPNNGLWWTKSYRFTKPQFLSEEIQKAVEKEDYELAEVLHKIEKK